jgi:hypothetical protein
VSCHLVTPKLPLPLTKPNVATHATSVSVMAATMSCDKGETQKPASSCLSTEEFSWSELTAARETRLDGLVKFAFKSSGGGRIGRLKL